MRFRKHLTDQWPRYALEAVTIVIGVLVAFWLNGWAERERSKELKDYYLRGLYEDVSRDAAHMESVIAQQQVILENLELLIEAGHQPPAANTRAADEQFDKALNNLTFFPTVGAFQAMKQQGVLNIVADTTIASEVIELYDHHYVRMSNFGSVLDKEVENTLWEIRGVYDLYLNTFGDPAHITRPEIRALFVHRHAYVEYYLGLSRAVLGEIKQVQAILDNDSEN